MPQQLRCDFIFDLATATLGFPFITTGIFVLQIHLFIVEHLSYPLGGLLGRLDGLEPLPVGYF